MNKDEIILLDHGSGGEAANQLINDVFLPAFDNPVLSGLADGAVLDVAGVRLAFSTDSFVVDPIFFPGGDIGHLAVNGTVNDIAMCGGQPKYLSAGFIIEEGFSLADLKRIVGSMQQAAGLAGVSIVTGDTKVVPQGAADKIYINTAGIGIIPEDVQVAADNARIGDKIIISGTMADHGMAVLSQREGLVFESSVESDCAPLNHLVHAMLQHRTGIHVLRDPTRGGVGTALNEIARQSNVGMVIHERELPVDRSVAGMCEFLGFDPLYVANEGKLLAVVAPEQAEAMMAVMQQEPVGRNARIIGEVVADHPRQLAMKTNIGGTRLVPMLSGEQLPRIC